MARLDLSLMCQHNFENYKLHFCNHISGNYRALTDIILELQHVAIQAWRKNIKLELAIKYYNRWQAVIYEMRQFKDRQGWLSLTVLIYLYVYITLTFIHIKSLFLWMSIPETIKQKNNNRNNRWWKENKIRIMGKKNAGRNNL